MRLTSPRLESRSRSDRDAFVTPSVPVVPLTGVHDPLTVPPEVGLLAQEDLRRLASVSCALHVLALDRRRLSAQASARCF